MSSGQRQWVNIFHQLVKHRQKSLRQEASIQVSIRFRSLLISTEQESWPDVKQPPGEQQTKHI